MRFADDYVVGFERREDAVRFLADLRERFAEFALELHPEKTRLIEFGRFAVPDRARRGERKPETFTFLGFTHICGKRRTTGMKKGMKESYIEDLANHGGPDHALATREGAAKRWTGVHAGQLLSLEIAMTGVPTRSQTTEGNTAGGVFASRQRTPRGRRTCACVRSLHAENREVPRSLVLVDDAPPYTARGVAYRRVAGRAGKAKAVIP